MTDVSVCIPTFNRKDLLLKTLESLTRQTLGTFEVVLADDGSTDGTAAAVRAKSWPFEIRVLELAHGGAPAARNAAAREARSPILAFLDSDVLPDSEWLASGLAAFNGEKIGAVEGRTIVRDATQRSPFTHQTENTEGGRYPTCNLFVNRSAFEAVGGFDASFGGRYFFREDSDFAFRLLDAGWKIPFAPTAVVDHPPLPARLTAPLRDARRYRYDPMLKRKHPKRYCRELDVHKILGVAVARVRQKTYLLYLLTLLATAVTLIARAPGWCVLSLAGLCGAAYLCILGAHKPWRVRGLAEAIAIIPMTLLVPWVYLYSRIEGWFLRTKSAT